MTTSLYHCLQINGDQSFTPRLYSGTHTAQLDIGSVFRFFLMPRAVLIGFGLRFTVGFAGQSQSFCLQTASFSALLSPINIHARFRPVLITTGSPSLHVVLLLPPHLFFVPTTPFFLRFFAFQRRISFVPFSVYERKEETGRDKLSGRRKTK